MRVGKLNVSLSKSGNNEPVIHLKLKNEVIDGITHRYYTITDDGLELRLRLSTLKGIVKYVKGILTKMGKNE